MNEQFREPTAAFKTPLADALFNLSRNVTSSFHALPIYGGMSLEQSSLKNKYEEVFGAQLLNLEMTITGPHFDSFFFGDKVICEAESMAATLYGADGTLFVTAGTTVSNQIAIDALYEQNMPVLLDKSCHQSMHFALHRYGAKVDYLQSIVTCEKSDKNIWSLNNLLALVLNAQHAGMPYELIILNAHSYDGVVYDVPQVIAYLLQSGVTTRAFLIDEAWGAANYFQKDLKPLTAMHARALLTQYPDLKIVATHSAHKSWLRKPTTLHHIKQFNHSAALGRHR
jgi:arginine/lysine/ornithine decarboxylase